jgi:hypothetical protein
MKKIGISDILADCKSPAETDIRLLEVALSNPEYGAKIFLAMFVTKLLLQGVFNGEVK